MSYFKRTLKSRHLMMIALGGSIGTGFFLGSGSALYEGGPGGSLLAYSMISIMVYFLMSSLGEMASYSPTSGTFCEYSSKYISSAFGFAMGWNYWFNWAITIAAEILAASAIMQFWFPEINTLYWSIFFFLVIFIFNIMSVKMFGEIEYWLSFIKVLFVLLFIIIGILNILGIIGINNMNIGIHNWVIGDAPFHHGIMGFLSVFLMAGFSFQGTELIGITAGEADNPQQSIPKAIKNTFWRLIIFYLLTISIISFLIPYNNEFLLNKNSDITMSPFTLIINNIFNNYAANFINFIILIAILSACNSSMYSGTRIIWYLAHAKQAPKLLSYINKKGVPLNGLLITSIIGSCFLFSVFIKHGTFFLWVVNTSAQSGFIAWFGIAFSHYRFRRAYIIQGYSIKDLPYKSKLFPIGPILSMIVIVIIFIIRELINIYQQSFNLHNFVTNYLVLLLFLMLFINYKIFYNSKLIPLKNVIFISNNKY